MSIPTLYLDHNAHAPILPEVMEAMHECYQAGYVNASSPHALGRKTKSLLEDTRERFAEMLGADLGGNQPDRIIFTSGGTESNNLAVFGISGGEPGRVITSAIEHPSVLMPCEELSRRGFQVRHLVVDETGLVQAAELNSLLDESTRLVTVMLGNNEIGTLQPIQHMAKVCQRHQVPFHTDAVQAIGKYAVNFHNLAVSSLSVSAHKFHGPTGIGALIVRGGCDLYPSLFGGHQQMGLRPGTEPIALIVGMCRALELWYQENERITAEMVHVRDRFEATIMRQLPCAVIHGYDAHRLPNTTNISFPHIDRQALLMALDLSGLACSNGSACASGSSEPSHVLLAMGCSKEIVNSSLRFSFGMRTAASEAEMAASRICRAVNDLQIRTTASFSTAGPRGVGRNSL